MSRSDIFNSLKKHPMIGKDFKRIALEAVDKVTIKASITVNAVVIVDIVL